MSRAWEPCRVCGNQHNNPLSSSICSPCGERERDARIQREQDKQADYEATPFGQFMGLSEEDRWRAVFEAMEENKRT